MCRYAPSQPSIELDWYGVVIVADAQVASSQVWTCLISHPPLRDSDVFFSHVSLFETP